MHKFKINPFLQFVWPRAQTITFFLPSIHNFGFRQAGKHIILVKKMIKSRRKRFPFSTHQPPFAFHGRSAVHSPHRHGHTAYSEDEHPCVLANYAISTKPCSSFHGSQNTYMHPQHPKFTIYTTQNITSSCTQFIELLKGFAYSSFV